jgi:hypothetical protein
MMKVTPRQLDLVLDHVYELNEDTPKIQCELDNGVQPDLIFGLDTSLFALTDRTLLGAGAPNSADEEKHHLNEVELVHIISTAPPAVSSDASLCYLTTATASADQSLCASDCNQPCHEKQHDVQRQHEQTTQCLEEKIETSLVEKQDQLSSQEHATPKLVHTMASLSEFLARGIDPDTADAQRSSSVPSVGPVYRVKGFVRTSDAGPVLVNWAC